MDLKARVFAIEVQGDASAPAFVATVSARSQLEAALLRHSNELRHAATVWVALSGGADSTALLVLLKQLFPEQNIRASHINHGVQRQAQAWAEQCSALCERLNVVLDVALLEPPANNNFAGGFEAWARRGRYRHWQHLLATDDLLLLGHHATDQRETVALKLLQGRLPVPMPKTRQLAVATGADRMSRSNAAPTLLRPWLELPGTLTRTLLTEAGIAWIEDPSNQSLLMLRNRVRAQLLPGLGERWCHAIDRTGRLVQRMVASFASENAVSYPSPDSHPDERKGELMRLPLAALDCPAAVRTLLRVAQTVGPPLSQRQIEGALASLKLQQSIDASLANRAGVALGRGLSLWLDDAALVVWREPNIQPQHVQLIGNAQQRVELQHGTLSIVGPAGARLLIRPPEPGEQFRGGSLRERLRAAAVPRWARASYPVICEGPAGSAALCLPRYLGASQRQNPPGSRAAATIAAGGQVDADFQPRTSQTNPRK